MKGTQHPAFTGDSPEFADCYTIQLADGTTLLLTTFDHDVYTTAPAITSETMFLKYGFPWPLGPSFRFKSVGQLIRRVKGSSGSTLSWGVGVKPNTMTLDVLNSMASIDSGFIPSAAARLGLFDNAQIKLWRVFGPFSYNADGLACFGGNSGPPLVTGLPSEPIPLFLGYVTQMSLDRTAVHLTVSDVRVLFNQVLPLYTFQPSCRWQLYSAGCTMNPANFQALATVQGGPTLTTVPVAVAQPVGDIDLGLLGFPSGYFDLGYVKFLTGKNAGVRRQIASFVNRNQDYPSVVLLDQPFAYYRMNDPVGSSMCRDFSGNNYNGIVYGSVAFGQTPLRVGDPSTSVSFNPSSILSGSNNRIALPTLPIPSSVPNYGGGVTVEFILKPGNQQFIGGIPVGGGVSAVFDTGPGQNDGLRCFQGNVDWNVSNGQPGSNNQIDDPSVPSFLSTFNTYHIVCVFYGNRTVDMYINGALQDSVTSGSGVIPSIAWGTFTKFYGPNGIPEPVNLGIVKQLASNTPVDWCTALVQDVSFYNYPFSASQPYYHYLASVAGAVPPLVYDQVLLVNPLLYIPAVGDQMLMFPGCDKTTRTCQKKFNNLLNYGGFPVMPEQETGL